MRAALRVANIDRNVYWGKVGMDFWGAIHIATLAHFPAHFLEKMRFIGVFVEARVRIELTYKGFADLSLTTWVPRPAGY